MDLNPIEDMPSPVVIVVVICGAGMVFGAGITLAFQALMGWI